MYSSLQIRTKDFKFKCTWVPEKQARKVNAHALGCFHFRNYRPSFLKVQKLSNCLIDRQYISSTNALSCFCSVLLAVESMKNSLWLAIEDASAHGVNLPDVVGASTSRSADRSRPLACLIRFFFGHPFSTTISGTF
eukprot:scaffold12246_cov16-Tisochrysis_lutea.AAC.1